jgi:hypothetical protein
VEQVIAASNGVLLASCFQHGLFGITAKKKKKKEKRRQINEPAGIPITVAYVGVEYR